MARGHILAAQKGRIGERYILANKNVSMAGFFRLIGEVEGVEPPKLKLPYPLMLTIGYMFSFIASITKKEPLITASMIKLTRKHACYDSSKDMNELGLPQTPIRTIIERAVNWYRENGYIKAS